jgi:hypothetical protein
MYVIVDENIENVFVGLNPRLNPRWISIKELSEENEGFQLAIFKNPQPTINFLEKQGIIAIAYRVVKLMDKLG